MSKLRRLAVAGAAITLAAGAPQRARGQFTTDDRSLFLAAVGGVTPTLFAGIFAVPRRAHLAQRGRGVSSGDIAPFAYSAGGGPLLDQGNGARGILHAVDAFLVRFDAPTPAFDTPASAFGSLVSGSSAVPTLFAMLARPGQDWTDDSQTGGDNASVPAFVGPPTQPAPAGAIGEITLRDPAGPLPAPLAVTATPEPASLTLMITGLLGMAGWTRRRKQKSAV